MDISFLTGFAKQAESRGCSPDQISTLLSKLAAPIPMKPNPTPVLNSPVQMTRMDAQPRPPIAPTIPNAMTMKAPTSMPIKPLS